MEECITCPSSAGCSKNKESCMVKNNTLIVTNIIKNLEG